MSKYIKAKIENKTTIELLENASAGDKIDLEKLEGAGLNIDGGIIADKLNSEQQKLVKEIESQTANKLAEEYNEKLKTLQAQFQAENKLELKETLDKEINSIKTQAQQQQEELQQIINQKEIEFHNLNNQLQYALKNSEVEKQNALLKKEQELQEQIQKEKSGRELVVQELENLKREKASLNVKQIGENLENWTEDEFQKYYGLNQNLHFEKFNKAIDGTKGDFILTIYDTENPDIELQKIMIECKSEGLNSSNKKKNSDHLPKLVKDKDNIKASIGILISELEREDEFEIKGAGRDFPGIYLCRPESFIALIQVIVDQINKNKQSIVALREQEMKFGDKQKFQENLLNFQESLNQTLEKIRKKREVIDKIADNLEKQAQELREANRIVFTDFGTLENKVNDATLRKLTNNSKLDEDNIFDNE